MNNTLWNEKRCELLAPAGTEQAFIAAVEAGADAVYLGGELFNARLNAGNFGREKMKAAVDFAHKRDVKVYVTVNTLIRDDELKEALDYCADLYNMGVDAVILQDMGLTSLIREYLPEFEIHLSTQGTAYNLDGVRAAEDMGFARVVTARELTFDEISYICSHSKAEIEVFVHGALCMCYSGQCQMSRFMGGRSGNRGACAQPCRLPYMAKDGYGKELKGKYLLSPSDLCLLEDVGRLIRCGVKSLKIEGRMKSPEYVGTVVSLYRKYMDLYYAHGSYEVDPEDVRALEQIFNRGGFTRGYMDGTPDSNFMSGDLPKHRGIRIGKVVNPDGGRNLIDVKLYEPLNMGDGIEIRGSRVSGNVVTYIKDLGNGVYRLGDFKIPVSKGDRVFRIVDRNQMKEAELLYKQKTLYSGKYERKVPVTAYADVDPEDHRFIIASLIDDMSGKQGMRRFGPFEEAEEERDLTGRIESAFQKTGGTSFSVERIFAGDTLKDTRLDIKMSDLNRMRRELIEELESSMTDMGRKPVILKEVTDIVPLEDVENSCCHEAELYFLSYDKFEDEKHLLDDGDIRGVIPLRAYMDRWSPDGREVVPYISNVTKGEEDRFLEERFDEIADILKDRNTPIYVGNLGWLKRFATAGVRVWGDYGLNIYNGRSAMAYKNEGMDGFRASLEMEEGGSYPLMTVEKGFKAETLEDRKGVKYRILRSEENGKSVLIPERDNKLGGESDRTKAYGSGRIYVF